MQVQPGKFSKGDVVTCEAFDLDGSPETPHRIGPGEKWLMKLKPCTGDISRLFVGSDRPLEL